MNEREQIVERARLAFISENYKEAQEICFSALQNTPNDINILLLLGCIKVKTNAVADGVEIIVRVIVACSPYRITLPPPDQLAADPSRIADAYANAHAVMVDRTTVNFHAGLILYSFGLYEKAVTFFKRALYSDPVFLPAHEALAVSTLVGDGYLQILKGLHDYFRPRGYLEIGVCNGNSIVLAKPPTVCVGVDPEPNMLFTPTAPTQIVKDTSDNYFASQSLQEHLKGRPLDMVFIDGLHQFEQVMKDFVNVEKLVHKKSIVLLHDCFPMDNISSSRRRLSRFWSGDVWKALLCIREKRPDLRIMLIKAKPTGLALITHCDPASTLLADNFIPIIAEYIDLSYEDFTRRIGAVEMAASSLETMRQELADNAVAPFS
jgi:tetratricopeptide (TPR) repeat protein